MKQCGISVDQWETAAGDRTKWRAGIKQGVELFEAKRLAAVGEKRATRKNCLQQQQAVAGGGDLSFVCGVSERLPLTNRARQPLSHTQRVADET